MTVPIRFPLFALVLLLGAVSGTPIHDAAFASQARFFIRLDLRPGERLSEYRYLNDRIEWKLPKKRLEPFIRAGVIIHEERHIRSVLHASVRELRNGVATLAGSADVNDVDIARHHERIFRQTFSGRLMSSDEIPGVDRSDIEDAAAAGLPARSMRPGDCWFTQRRVMTSLGSGDVGIRHCLASREGFLIRIDVHGDGQITGQEYHLPKLLPGSIELDGISWFDLNQRLVTQESYRIHNRLLKPAEHEQIGFDEILDVDISTRRD